MYHANVGWPLQKEEARVRNKVVLVAVLLIVVFLASFLPPYAKAHRLETELREARRTQALAQLRDLASLAYFQASQRDYGLAAGTSTRFFNRAREVANQAPDIGAKKPLEDLLNLRDPITAGLAKGDPAVLSDLEVLFVKTRQATEAPDGAPQSE